MQQSLASSRKPLKILMLLAPLFLLTACAASIRSSNEPPRLDAAPPALAQSCAKPVRLPNRTLLQQEVERLWLRDRAALIACGTSKEELLRYYQDRDARITEAP